MNLAYVDVNYWKFKSIFNKIEVDEESNLPVFAVLDNFKG